jgi:tetratricopeptide (TPR) repeat protein
MKFKILGAGLLLLLTISDTTHFQGAPPSIQPKELQVTAFLNVNVVPMDKEQVLEQQTVIIRSGQISEIGPATKVKVPVNAKRIDGRGKYLMPGLVDMHVHLRSETELPLYVINGVTTVFNLNGRPAHLIWREKIARGEIFGPTIYSCGPKFEKARTPEESVKEVEAQSKAGYDAVKIYTQVSKAEYPALMAAARSHNMIIVGHVPREVGFEGMLKAGQALEHAEEYLYTYFNDSLDIDTMKLDESRIPQAVAMTRESGIWLTPTLVTYDQIVQQADDLTAFLARPEMKYISPALFFKLSPENNQYKRGISPRQVPKFKQSLLFQKKLVRALHVAGVPMLAGTDSMGIGTTAGYSLHEELREFIDSGFTPFESLQTATSNAAEFLMAANEFGTVTVGKRADLILLERNPLVDVANTTRRAGVMVRGRWFPEKELLGIRDDLPAVYAREEKAVKNNLEQDIAKAIEYLDENDPFGFLSSYVLTSVVLEQGSEKLSRIVREMKKGPRADATLVSERTINDLGYLLKRMKRFNEAIAVFKLNVETYPKSANTYDSLAEVYDASGEFNLAIDYYKKALEVNPKYPNAEFATEYLKKTDKGNFIQRYPKK